MRKRFLVICLCMLSLISCKEDKNTISTNRCIDRDGKEYKTVMIGNQLWMAENLAYLPPGELGKSVVVYECAVEDKAKVMKHENYSLYGALYTYDGVIANNICPEGWHIPSHEEWGEMEMFLGMTKEQIDDFQLYKASGEIANKLKSESYWLEYKAGYQGTNESGFNAVPSGMRRENNYFLGLGKRCTFWTSTIRDNEDIDWPNSTDKEVVIRKIFHNEKGIQRFMMPSNRFFSIRCVKDK